ncbi:very short patch repair endonuclease [Pseudomonas knackmussii]|uniref:very short patch repair endonuclease n=1 Tax=Pseudomonas knackmussii TaxID=65741 RepID=UPI003F49F171
MVDVHTPEARSRNMRAIRSKDTKPELLIRKTLHARGFRYRLGGANLPGRPDIVLPKYKTAIFIHGCFWHGHDCKYFKLPATRTEFWADKIRSNQRRDQHSVSRLLEQGWSVLTVWECSLKPSGVGLEAIMHEIEDTLAQRIDGEASCALVISGRIAAV